MESKIMARSAMFGIIMAMAMLVMIMPAAEKKRTGIPRTGRVPDF